MTRGGRGALGTTPFYAWSELDEPAADLREGRTRAERLPALNIGPILVGVNVAAQACGLDPARWESVQSHDFGNYDPENYRPFPAYRLRHVGENIVLAPVWTMELVSLYQPLGPLNDRHFPQDILRNRQWWPRGNDARLPLAAKLARLSAAERQALAGTWQDVRLLGGDEALLAVLDAYIAQ